MTNNLNKYEQQELVNYCVNRKLVRPNTNSIKAIKYLLLLELVSLISAFAIARLLVFVDISYDFALLHLSLTIILFLVFSKRFLILFVELYQHYASEERRRKCTLKPSCSEYAILALKKYGVIKACIRIYIRLFKKCNGIYKIDYP